MNNKKLSTDTYKGARDFYPEDMFVQKYLFDAMRRVVERFGYTETNGPTIEPIELFAAKTGEEIVSKQSYTFEDRGGRTVTLRPEMTPTVARMFAKKFRELTIPTRWFSFANFFRYERMQKGRTREFWQMNVDCIGLSDLSADIESISIAYWIMKEFGLEDDQFEIRINDRELINETLADAGLNEEQAYRMQKLIDKKDKITEEEFVSESAKIAGKNFVFEPQQSPRLEKLLKSLKDAGVMNAVFSPTLMRGLDYYTSTVFEVFDKNPSNSRSVFGGGRYDNLTNIFGAPDMPFIGFAIGDVVIRDVLDEYGLIPKYTPPTQLAVCFTDPESQAEAAQLIASFRQDGLSIATADAGKKVGDQIKQADKLQIPFVLCIGPKELDSKTYSVKELSTGNETTLTEDAIVAFVKEQCAR